MMKYLTYFIIFFCIFSLNVEAIEDDPTLPFHHYESPIDEPAEKEIIYRLEADPLNIIATFLFACAILHTFFANKILAYSKSIEKKKRKKTIKSEIIHFFGEIEIIFGIWTIPVLIAISSLYSWQVAIDYLNSRNYSEALAVVVIIVLTSSYPILVLVKKIFNKIASFGNDTPQIWWFSLLTIGPILGSLITEAGAMIITGTLLSEKIYHYKISEKFKYATIALLFTNISLGGIITTFSSPPALLASQAWEWDTAFMFFKFGWKSILTILISNLVYYLHFHDELKKIEEQMPKEKPSQLEKRPKTTPAWIIITHIVFIVFVVMHLHDIVICAGAFFLFLGFYQATQEYQTPLILRPALLVGFFIASLVIHGGLQEWWIAPLLHHATPKQMLFTSLTLGPLTDNGALVYLATLIPHLSDLSKYAMMVGAVVAGGLTIIANAPNPAGYQILNHHFKKGISAKNLFLWGLIPTIIGLVIFIVLK